MSESQPDIERGNPLRIPYPICSAKVGEKCAGLVDASRTFDVPHGIRVAFEKRHA